MENSKDKTWSTKELQENFQVLSFNAPFVLVIDKKTGKKGSLQFDHSPRVYFNFVED